MSGPYFPGGMDGRIGRQLINRSRQIQVVTHDFEGGEESKQIYRAGDKIPRNSPCPCGSGKKFKKCCRGKRR